METERCPFNGVDCEYIPLARKAATQADEIERLREALKDIDSQMRQADRYLLKESTLAALQQKDSD